MKYFFDTEFVEYPCTIDLISIGVVCEDGREYYAENMDTDWSKASQWVLDNVRPQLNVYRALHDLEVGSDESEKLLECVHVRETIAQQLLRFVGADKPEFWAYYGDYDWVVFCWLFGSMIDLPEGFPMYCRDLKQWADQLGAPSDGFPKQAEGEHNALHDARWNLQLFHHLMGFEVGAQWDAR
jgi:hypothetical protein